LILRFANKPDAHDYYFLWAPKIEFFILPPQFSRLWPTKN